LPAFFYQRKCRQGGEQLGVRADADARVLRIDRPGRGDVSDAVAFVQHDGCVLNDCDDCARHGTAVTQRFRPGTVEECLGFRRIEHLSAHRSRAASD
jgi:hypothetical protein